MALPTLIFSLPQRPTAPPLFASTPDALDEMSSMTASHHAAPNNKDKSILSRERRGGVRSRAKGRQRDWIWEYSVNDDILTYDPILDKHCMFTKSPSFHSLAQRLVKVEYQERYKRRHINLKKKAVERRFSLPPASRPQPQPKLRSSVSSSSARSSLVYTSSTRTSRPKTHIIDRRRHPTIHSSSSTDKKRGGLSEDFHSLSSNDSTLTSSYTALSPYLSPNGPYLLPQNRRVVPTEVTDGTILLMLPGITVSVATISHGPLDTLDHLRKLINASLTKIFPAGFLFMDKDMNCVPFMHEDEVHLSDLGGAVFMRPRVHKTVALPFYMPEGDDDVWEESSRASKRRSHPRMRFDSMTLGTTRMRRLSVTGSLADANKEEDNQVAAFEETVARLVAKYTQDAARKMQRVARGRLGRRKATAKRQAIEQHKKWTQAAIKIQTTFRRFSAVLVVQRRKAELVDMQMTLRARFADTFDFDSKTMRLAPDDATDEELDDLRRHPHEALPLVALLAIIKIQSAFRRNLAQKKAEQKMREREKDMALDAAFGGNLEMVESGGSSKLSERRKQWLLKERRKALQAALAEAQRAYFDRERKKKAKEEAAKLTRRTSTLAAAPVVAPSSPPTSMQHTIHEVKHEAKVEDMEGLGDLVHETEVPMEDGVIAVAVYKSEDTVRFVASASNRAYGYHLIFRADSPDQEVADYFAALAKPQGFKLYQLMSLAVKYSTQRMNMVMDLEAYGGKCHLFEVDNDDKRQILLDSRFRPQSFVAKRYLIIRCYALECEDCHWRIRVDAVNSATGEELTTRVGSEQWSKLGMGLWEHMCTLERQFLIRVVCIGLRLVKNGSNGLWYLDAKIPECSGGESRRRDSMMQEVMTDPKHRAIQLHPVDIDFAISNMPERRLLSRMKVTIQGEGFILTCYQEPTQIHIRAYRVETGAFYEADLPAEDTIYFAASPVDDTMALCRQLCLRISFTIDYLGSAALQLPIDTIQPFVRFSYDTWQGEPRSFTVHVYKAGNKLLVVARERQAHDTHFAVIRSGQYKKWDIPNLRRVHEDSNAQEALITLLKACMNINRRPLNNNSVYLCLEVEGNERKERRQSQTSRWNQSETAKMGESWREQEDLDAQDSVIDEALVAEQLKRPDASLSYKYVGVLVDRDF